MTIQEVIRALEDAGWETTKSEDELHQLKQDQRCVTIAGKLELSVPTGVHRILWRHVQLEEKD